MVAAGGDHRADLAGGRPLVVAVINRWRRSTARVGGQTSTKCRGPRLRFPVALVMV
ncbi:MAG: hypothetical protein V3T72_02190 [Thermoanaerobaculia bacterium]